MEGDLMRQWTCFLLGLSGLLTASVGRADPGLEESLSRWKMNSQYDDPCGHGVATLIRYDNVFETDTRGRVEYWIEDDRWRLDITPWKGDAKTKKAPCGRDYTIKE